MRIEGHSSGGADVKYYTVSSANIALAKMMATWPLDDRLLAALKVFFLDNGDGAVPPVFGSAIFRFEVQPILLTNNSKPVAH